MPRVKEAVPRSKEVTRPKDEHIFPETKIRPLVQSWKRLIEQGKQREAMVLLEEIIIDSTEMFKRLAQHEKFHHAVPLDSLVSSAQEKIPKWLTKWDPAKGSLFSWLSTCAKNVFRSELVKTTTFTRRIHCTDDDTSLERLSGFTDDGQSAKDSADSVALKIHSMTCSWAYPELRMATQYIIECVTQEGHNKQDCIRGASFAWGVGLDVTKFLYSWTLIQMRTVLYHDTQLRLTEQDIFQAVNRFTALPQILDVIGWEAMRKLMAILNGQRVRFPTIAELHKAKQEAAMTLDMAKSDNDPEALAKVAQKYGKSEKAALEVFSDMVRILDPAMSGEYPVYDDCYDDKLAVEEP